MHEKTSRKSKIKNNVGMVNNGKFNSRSKHPAITRQGIGYLIKAAKKTATVIKYPCSQRYGLLEY